MFSDTEWRCCQCGQTWEAPPAGLSPIQACPYCGSKYWTAVDNESETCIVNAVSKRTYHGHEYPFIGWNELEELTK